MEAYELRKQLMANWLQPSGCRFAFPIRLHKPFDPASTACLKALFTSLPGYRLRQWLCLPKQAAAPSSIASAAWLVHRFRIYHYRNISLFNDDFQKFFGLQTFVCSDGAPRGITVAAPASSNCLHANTGSAGSRKYDNRFNPNFRWPSMFLPNPEADSAGRDEFLINQFVPKASRAICAAMASSAFRTPDVLGNNWMCGWMMCLTCHPYYPYLCVSWPLPFPVPDAAKDCSISSFEDQFSCTTIAELIHVPAIISCFMIIIYEWWFIIGGDKGQRSALSQGFSACRNDKAIPLTPCSHDIWISWYDTADGYYRSCIPACCICEMMEVYPSIPAKNRTQVLFVVVKRNGPIPT